MIKKFYLTRTQTRAMSLDHPIGDPTGGAAYGEKRDPLSAAISIFSMYTSGAAIAANGLTLLSGLQFVGSALSLVGNITGNKTLSQIGMVAGLAGGIGSLASDFGLFDSKALDASIGLGKGKITDAMMQDRNYRILETPLGGGTPAAVGADINSVAADFVKGGGGVEGAPNPLNLSSPGNLLEAPAALAAGTEAAPAAGVAPPALQADYSLQGPGTGMGLKLPGGAPVGLPAAKPGALDLLKQGKFGDAAMTAGSGAMDMLKTNPTGAYVASKAVGGLADWLSGRSEAELEQIKANTGYANAKALEVQATVDREKMRRANLNAGYGSVNAGFKINPNAVVAQPPGLVAGAMQPRSA
jgi:hypothetical protein